MNQLKTANTLKGLKTQLTELELEALNLKTEENKIKNRIESNKHKIDNIRTQIENIQSREITISEHAILRYLERVKMIDIKNIPGEIITDDLKEMVEKLGGSGVFPIKDKGFSVRMKNHSIITIITGKDN